MILGYNKSRPTEKNYKDFMDKLVGGLEKLSINGLSLMIYGSYVRGDYNPGRSDIDAVMTFSDNVIINKQDLGKVARVLHHALKDNNIPFQVSVNDLITMKDGRFNTYDESFKNYFVEEGKIVFGSDYRSDFKYEIPNMNEQTPVRFNLRKARIGLLFAEHDRQEDYDTFLKRFTKTLDSVSRGSKQILSFMDGELRKHRFSAYELVKLVFPHINIKPLEQIKDLYSNPEELDNLYEQPDEILKLWNSSLTFFEEMIKAYIEKVPKDKKIQI